MPSDKPDAALMMELAKRQLQAEMPKETAAATVEPMTAWDRMLFLGRPASVYAFTSPFNHVKYDPDLMKQNSQTANTDILAHELTHVRQNQRTPVLSQLWDLIAGPLTEPDVPYGQRPEELEAFQTERDRALAQHRVPDLPFPSFSGQRTLDSDIELQTKAQRNKPKPTYTVKEAK